MTKSEFKQAFDLANTKKDIGLPSEVFFGYGLPDFKPVCVSIVDVASLIRWQCFFYICGHGIDFEEFNKLEEVARTKFQIINS